MASTNPQLQSFDAQHAARVASWVRSDRELNWLSPDTPPPMTTTRVLNWGGTGHRQFLLTLPGNSTPMGYAELNDMPSSYDDLWLGHMLLDPGYRGRGLGAACVRALMVQGFDVLAAQQIILVVVPENKAAIGSYLRAGFVQRGDEWKKLPGGGPPYRLLRMTIERERYYELCALGEMPADLLQLRHDAEYSRDTIRHMKLPTAARLDALPPYLFVEIDRRKRAAIDAGRDVIDLGVGDPDRPTFDFIIERMDAAMRDARNHRYPSGVGIPEFRETVAAWFTRRFGVALDPDREVLSLIGSKEGLGHVPLALLNAGDVALVPRPGYPVYHSATIFAGGEPYIMPLTASRGWLPDLAAIPADVLARTSLMFLNYPNNPIGATAPLSFFEEAVRLARKHEFWIMHDAAYSEMGYDERPPSILQVEGSREVCIEMHSLSKTFNMTGWRLGFAVGNADALAALAKVKNNVDSGAFNAIQLAGAEAMRRIDGPEVAAMRATYRARRDLFVGGLRAAGFRVEPPAATFFVWAAAPGGYDSMGCVGRMLEEQAVVAIPGSGFGPEGEGYVRFSLTTELDRLRECVERLGRIKW